MRSGRLDCIMGDVKPELSDRLDCITGDVKLELSKEAVGIGLAPNRDGRDTDCIVAIRGDEGPGCA
jgi:hypothetical protein